MDQAAQHAGLGEPLEVGAGLAQPPSLALHLADREATAHQGVERDAARDQVAAGLGGAQPSSRPGAAMASSTSPSISVSARPSPVPPENVPAPLA